MNEVDKNYTSQLIDKRRRDCYYGKIYKKRNVLITTIIICLFMLCTKANVFAAPKIQYTYSSSVTCGTIRYISQVTGSQYFNWSYWPANAFGEYYSPGWECGTCSISMALSYIGINKTPKQILEANNGVTYFTGWGATLSSPSVSGGMDNYLNGKGKYSPVIVHFPESSTYPNGHFVVLIDRLSSSSYQVLDCAKDTTWNLSTSSSLYKQIDKVYQYYNPSAEIPVDPAPTPIPTGTQTISDGDYYITSYLDESYYVNVENNSTSAEANIELGTDKQIFTVTYIGDGYYQIASKNSGMNLDVEDYGKTNGTNICQYYKTKNSNQKWVIRPDSWKDGYEIISVTSGLAMEINGGKAFSGANIATWQLKYNSGGNTCGHQKWRFTPVFNGKQVISDGDYSISTALNSNYFLGIPEESLENGANVELVTSPQIFTLKYMGDGFYSITAKKSNYNLTVQGYGKVNGSNVIQQNKTGWSNQKWIIQSNGNGRYFVISQTNGLFMEVQGGKAGTGANIDTWAGHKSNNQQWIFNKIIYSTDAPTSPTEPSSPDEKKQNNKENNAKNEVSNNSSGDIQDNNTTQYNTFKKVKGKPKLKNVNNRKMKVSFKKVKGARGYEIQYSTNKKFKKSKTITVYYHKNNIINKLKKGKTYYVKVRAFRRNRSFQKEFGAYSKVAKIVVKK